MKRMAEIRDELAVLENRLVKLMDRKKSKEATVPHGGSLKKESVSAASGTCEKVRPQLCRSSVSMIAKILQDKPQPAGSGSKPGPAGSMMIPDSGKSSTDQQLSPESGIAGSIRTGTRPVRVINLDLKKKVQLHHADNAWKPAKLADTPNEEQVRLLILTSAKIFCL